jgi:hypothetical protein
MRVGRQTRARDVITLFNSQSRLTGALLRAWQYPVNSHATLVFVWLEHESWENSHANSRFSTLINSHATLVLVWLEHESWENSHANSRFSTLDHPPLQTFKTVIGRHKFSFGQNFWSWKFSTFNIDIFGTFSIRGNFSWVEMGLYTWHELKDEQRPRFHSIWSKIYYL